MKNLQKKIELARKTVMQSDAILITAGAGMGVDSGLPDFRGNDGFWREYPPIKKLGLSFSQMANPTWFEIDPNLAWAFYGHRLNLYRNTTPNNGFYHIINYIKKTKKESFVFTSNVDGQFQKSGFLENRIIECHGSIHYFQCSKCCSGEIWSAKNIKIDIDKENFKVKGEMPFCNRCGLVARPNILMFSDVEFIPTKVDEQYERFEKWLTKTKLENKKLVIIEIGAGEAVPTVRNLSESIALNRYNTTLIRINPRDFEIPDGHISLPLGGLEAISKIFKSL